LDIGPYEIMVIIQAALKDTRQLIKEKNTILAGLRRNGYLAWRPNLHTKCFDKASGQAWCADLPEGSHRMAKNWMKPRYEWLDPSGKPKPTDWTKMKEAKDMAGMMEHAYCQTWKDRDELVEYTSKNGHGVRLRSEEGAYIDLVSDVGAFASTPAEEKDVVNASINQMHPNERREKQMGEYNSQARGRPIDENAGADVGEIKKKGGKGKFSRADFKQASVNAAKKVIDVCDKQRELGYSRQKIMAGIVPAAGPPGKGSQRDPDRNIKRGVKARADAAAAADAEAEAAPKKNAKAAAAEAKADAKAAAKAEGMAKKVIQTYIHTYIHT
jgi:hypothetical protein